MTEEKELQFTAPSWNHIEKLAVELYNKVIDKQFLPDMIAGISRGGLVPARIISDLFMCEFPNTRPTLSIMQIGFYSGVGKTEKKPIIYQDLPGLIHGKKILLIDDVADSGVSLDFALKYLKMKNPAEVQIGTLYYKEWSLLKPHFYIETTDKWIIFPHERYEFMAEQLRKKEMSEKKAKSFFIDTCGIPEYSVKQFLKLFFK